MAEHLAELLNISVRLAEHLSYTALALALFVLLKLLAAMLVNRRFDDDKRRYHARKTANYILNFLLVAVIGSIWFKGMASLGTFLGLASAGLAVALHDTIANMAGFFFISARKPFKVGDRIQLAEFKGDVIDIV